MPRAEVLAGDGADRKSERDDRHEPRLQDAHPNAEPRLRGRSERATERIHDEQVNCREPELGARREADLEEISPQLPVRNPL